MSRGSIDWFARAIHNAPPIAPDLPDHIEQGRVARSLQPGLFSIAPMIDKTNRHFRYFLRLLTRRAVLYTEMVTALAIIHGKRGALLDYDQVEHPVVLQLGGDDPEELAQAVSIAEDWGYDEYNLNVGCPSDKVQKGSFGACLMADPQRVADIVAAMSAETTKPVSIKQRVGITGFGYQRESFAEMVDFVRTVANSGSDRFVVHARIAMLEGLSPKENRVVPPLRYDDVYRLKALYPGLHVELNGQVRSLAAAAEHLQQGMDGIMIGRASYEQPLMMAGLDAFESAWSGIGLPSGVDKAQAAITAGQRAIDAFDSSAAILQFAEYIQKWSATGVNPRAMIWPVLELFPGVRGNRKFKQILSQPYPAGANVVEMVRLALNQLLQVASL